MKNDYEVLGDVTAIFLKRRNGDIVETLISTSDLPKVKDFPGRWFAMWHQGIKGFYVKGHTPMVNGKQDVYLLHRWLCDNPKGLVIDHINHDTLNNTRPNLRVLTHAENCQNKKGANANNRSKIRGVTWHKNHKKWQAKLKLNGKQIYLGMFDSMKFAEKAVVEARKIYMPYAN